MIAFNERLEAANLLKLLKESRSRLAAFNQNDRQIAQACGADLSDPDAVVQARLAWYLRLALWEEQRRLNGCCSLVFNRVDRIQRMPYDLLACYPLTREEREQAEVPPNLLSGLSPREQARQRRLYHRLLCITPMRRLLERLCELAKLVRECGDDRERLLALTGDARWRRPIAMTEERRSGQSLNVRDNDFTILDRLIANHGRTLRRNRIVSIPRSLLGRADVPESLLLAAIAGSLDRSETRSTCTQYRTIPGGHVRLDVYRSGTMEDFLKRAGADQAERAERLVYIRPYAGYQLIQLPGDMAGRVPHERRRRLRRCRSAGSGRTWRMCAPAAAAPEQPASGDWRELCRLIGGLAALPAQGALQTGGIAVLDNGGNAAYRTLKATLDERAAAAASAAPAGKKVKPADNERCMFDFFKGSELPPMYFDRALSELRRHTELFFAADELPQKYSSEPAKPISNGGANWQSRAVKLLLAYAAGERLIADERTPGRIPATVDAALRGIEADPQERGKFLAFMDSLKRPEPGWPKLMVNVRYGSVNGRSMFLCCRTPLTDDGAVKRWISAGGLQESDVTPELLRQMCLYGLRRHLLGQTGVTTPEGKGFRLAVNRTGVPKEPDLVFRLFVIHAVLRLTGLDGAAAGATVEAVLKKNFGQTEKSYLADVKKGRAFFVEEGEQTGIAAAEFTPERLPEIASLAFHWNLRITAGLNDEDIVCLQRVT